MAILREPEGPTAIFASSDPQALGALEAARRSGISVLGDLSVISFDSTMAAASSSPALTAIRQPFEEMGREATRMVLQMSDGTTPVSRRIELATDLVIRGSTPPHDRRPGAPLGVLDLGVPGRDVGSSRMCLT